MNGIHDMGGMDGFGRVEPEQYEPVFHEDWERRVFALASGFLSSSGIKIDEYRHAIERIPPVRYLSSSYYERWLLAMETLLAERGMVTREELKSLPAPASHAAAPPTQLPANSAQAPRPRAKYKPGDRVRVRNMNPSGHTRSPRYVRGKTGTIRRDHGTYVFADTYAHHAGENRQHVYSVEFTARELWGRPEREHVMIDLWEDYLEREHSAPRVTAGSKHRAARPSPVATARHGKKRQR
jgi:nitrile hydratase